MQFANADNEWDFSSLPYSPKRYIISMGRLYKRMRNNQLGNHILIIDYNDMIEKTEIQIDKIINFLNIPNDKKQDAINNIDPNLQRNTNAPQLESEDWTLAIDIYNSIKSANLKQSIVDRTDQYKENIMFENKRWLDEEIWEMCNSELYQKLQNDPVLKKSLINNAQNRVKTGKICISCDYYNRNGDIYEITRNDLEPLARNMIRCEKMEKDITLEHCQNHWRQLNA